MSGYRFNYILIHIASCLLFVSLPLIFVGNQSTEDAWLLLSSGFYWLFCLSFLGLYYLNSWVLIPKLLVAKRYGAYTVSLLTLLLIFFMVKPFDLLIRHAQPDNNVQDLTSRPLIHRDGPPPPEFMSGPDMPDRPIHRGGPMLRPMPRFDLISLFIFVMVVALSTAVGVTARWKASENRATEAENAKTAAELSFLKAQVNPHFLFNTLNNIYTLALTHNEHTAESILRLSNIMRYMTDGDNDDLVPLQREADCIRDYIALQMLRLGKTANIEISIAENLQGYEVPPLILMGFIENAFKYGISKKYSSPIIIMLHITQKGITFFCKNQVHKHQQNEKGGGIGLANARKRLDALFKNRYQLDLKQEDDNYTAVLTINQ